MADTGDVAQPLKATVDSLLVMTHLYPSLPGLLQGVVQPLEDVLVIDPWTGLHGVSAVHSRRKCPHQRQVVCNRSIHDIANELHHSSRSSTLFTAYLSDARLGSTIGRDVLMLKPYIAWALLLSRSAVCCWEALTLGPVMPFGSEAPYNRGAPAPASTTSHLQAHMAITHAVVSICLADLLLCNRAQSCPYDRPSTQEVAAQRTSGTAH